MSRWMLLFCLSVFLSPVAAFAENQDEGLYDPVPPAGSAFVRFINADPEFSNKDEKPVANGKTYSSLDYAEVSPYFVFRKGALKTSFSKASTETTLEEGKFYTQIVRGDRIVTLTDKQEGDKDSKAQLVFYNLSVTPEVSLKTTDGKIAITPQPVKSGEAASRAVNAIKLKPAIYGGENKIADVPELSLERGKAYAIVLLSDAQGEPKVVTATSRTDSTK